MNRYSTPIPNPGDLLLVPNEHKSLFLYRQLHDGTRAHLATSSAMLRKRGLSAYGVQGTPKQDWRPAPDFTVGRCEKGQARALVLKYYPELLADPATRVLWRTTDGWSVSTQETISDRRKSRDASPK